MNIEYIDKIPTTTIELIKYLDDWYKDELDTRQETVGTPDYWKKAGVIELLRVLKDRIKYT